MSKKSSNSGFDIDVDDLNETVKQMEQSFSQWWKNIRVEDTFSTTKKSNTAPALGRSNARAAAKARTTGREAGDAEGGPFKAKIHISSVEPAGAADGQPGKAPEKPSSSSSPQVAVATPTTTPATPTPTTTATAPASGGLERNKTGSFFSDLQLGKLFSRKAVSSKRQVISQEFLSEAAWADFQEHLPEELRDSIDTMVSEGVSLEMSKDEVGEVVAQFISAGTERWAALVTSGPAKKLGRATVMHCLEKSVCEALFGRIFGHWSMEADLALSNRIASLDFVLPEHLGMPAGTLSDDDGDDGDGDLSKANEMLYRMMARRAPFEKLSCVLAFSEEILKLLSRGRAEDAAPGADDFLPMVIYALLRANPPCLISNIEYIGTFRHPSFMHSESAYFFCSFVSAVRFIERVSAADLGIAEPEFEAARQAPKEHREKFLRLRRERVDRDRERRGRLLDTHTAPADLKEDDIEFLLAYFRRREAPTAATASAAASAKAPAAASASASPRLPPPAAAAPLVSASELESEASSPDSDPDLPPLPAISSEEGAEEEEKSDEENSEENSKK